MAPNVQSLGPNIDKVLICDVHNGWGKCEWCEWFKHLGLIVNQKKKTSCIRDIKSELSKKGHTTGVIFFCFQNATNWWHHKSTFFHSMLRNEHCYSWQMISFQYWFVTSFTQNHQMTMCMRSCCLTGATPIYGLSFCCGCWN